MNTETIEKLTHNWCSTTWKVIELEKVDLTALQRLIRDTYNVLDKLCTEKLVPKEMCGLLLEMHEFSWWVSDLKDTPMYYLYQEIVSLVNDLNKYFLTRDADITAIQISIQQLI